jgi:deazaflavin-dependent oxidoreductase (nitroreductase family)
MRDSRPEERTMTRSRPSLFARVVIKPMTRVLNPLVRKAAGRKHFSMAARINHVGRRSGRLYVTPASARLDGDDFYVPLTFGSRSDWCRNVLAADGCTITWRGRDYNAIAPEILDRKGAWPEMRHAFKRSERLGLRVLGVKQVLRLHVFSEVGPTLGS